MEVFIAITVWLLLGLPGYAVVLGGLQRDEWDYLGLKGRHVVLSVAFMALGPIGSLMSLTGYEGKPLRLIPKQFDWRR